MFVAVVAATGSGVAAWISGRAGARKALEVLAAKVTALEGRVDELRELMEREGAEDTDELRRLRADFERHLSDESRARSRRHEAGRQRDEALASKLEALAGDVREQGAYLKLVLDGRVDTGGGCRGR